MFGLGGLKMGNLLRSPVPGHYKMVLEASTSPKYGDLSTKS